MIRELLGEVFGWVCGQAPEHTWAPGGIMLPCCQRCTGLYVGAAVSFLLQLVLRVRPGSRLLALYGLCLLQMIPFGFHLVPQGPVLRTVSGWLFACGLVGYLWLWPSQRVGRQSGTRPARTWFWFWGVMAGGAAVVWAVERGGSVSGWLLAGLGLAGLLVLFFLVTVNVVWLVASLSGGRRWRKPVPG